MDVGFMLKSFHISVVFFLNCVKYNLKINILKNRSRNIILYLFLADNNSKLRIFLLFYILNYRHLKKMNFNVVSGIRDCIWFNWELAQNFVISENKIISNDCWDNVEMCVKIRLCFTDKYCFKWTDCIKESQIWTFSDRDDFAGTPLRISMNSMMNHKYK